MVNRQNDNKTVVKRTKQGKTGFLMALGILLLSSLSFAVPALGAQMIFDRVWKDFNTGYALAGYDPVAYFTDSEPRLGTPSLEVEWEGYYFHFANEGNRQAFIENPEVYLPAFGGFSPVQLAKGRMVEGNPLFWTLENGRLLLFQSKTELVKWQMHTEALAADANRVWSSLRQI